MEKEVIIERLKENFSSDILQVTIKNGKRIVVSVNPDTIKIIPVDAYIPGCPPKPEAIIAGIVKLVNKS